MAVDAHRYFIPRPSSYFYQYLTCTVVKMKASTFAAIIMAIVPALADSPFHMLCPRSLWNGAGDEQQFYRTLYRNFCQSEQYNCRDLMDGPTGFNFGENWVEGICVGCPDDVVADKPAPACKAWKE